jgi:predicted ATPase/signal transduction histidine kinase
MASSLEYNLTQSLGSSSLANLFRGTDGKGHGALFRVSLPGALDRSLIQLFQNDFSLSQELGTRCPSVLQALYLDIKSDSAVLQLENFPGQPLASLTLPLSTGEFLELATALVRGLQEIHDEGVVHCFLNPNSILYERESGKVKICDFGFALQPSGRSTPLGPGLAKEEFAYMSPEQSGRIGRPVDSRTDFYSLGIIFYQLLSGRLPFEAHDALGWFHSHMTVVPPPLSTRAPECPPTLENIVSKLLSKMAEERYQSTRGLLADLEFCKKKHQEGGSIPAFPLGKQERNSYFAIPERLYGREAEFSQLKRAFEKTAASGELEILSISGYSGVGKTSLVRKLEATVIERNGKIVSGKFDRQNGGVPHFTFVMILRELVLDLLAAGESSLQSWKMRIHKAIGENTSFLTELVPEFALLAPGTSGNLSEKTAPAERESRLQNAVQTFLNMLAGPSHPLVLFLDDLQWADTASLKLFEGLATGGGLRHILLICSYRENEVDHDHPLARTFTKIRESGRNIPELRLEPLSRDLVLSLLVDALHEDPEYLKPLVDQIFAKTAGNPFFVQQFLRTIYSERLLRFDGPSGHWTWSLEKIADLNYTDSALDLITKMISRLPATTRATLEIAAYLGPSFDADLLSRITLLGFDETREALVLAEQEHLVVKERDSWKFQHDKIRQAAFELSAPEARARTHLEIGRKLHSRNSWEQIQISPFEIVNHLNAGRSQIRDREELSRLARLNLVAGKKAKSSAAQKAAADYFHIGLSLLDEQSWTQDYQLTFDLHLESAEADYQASEFVSAKRKLALLEAHARTDSEKAQAYSVWMSLYTTMGEMNSAIGAGMRALSLLGWDFPLAPTKDQAEKAELAVSAALRERDVEALVDLPELEERRLLLTMKLLNGVLLPAHFVGGHLNKFVTAQMILLGIRNGVTPEFVLSLSWFAATLVSRSIGRYEEGYRIGKLSYELMKKHSYLQCKSRVCLFFGDIVNFYKHPFREDRSFILEGFEAGVATGDLVSACYHCNHLITNMIVTGEPLEDVLRECRQRLKFVRKARDPNIEDILIGQERYLMNLLGLTASPFTFDGPGFNAEEFEHHIEGSEMTLMKFWYYSMKMKALFIAGDQIGALRAANVAEEFSGADQFDAESTQFFFFFVLVLAGSFRDFSDTERQTALTRIRSSLGFLAAWSEACPQNFECRHLLAKAELARIESRLLEALSLYEQGIASAEKNGFPHIAAIGCELAGKCLREQGHTVGAEGYETRALFFFNSWGARGKATALRKKIIGTSAETDSEQGLSEQKPSHLSFSNLVDLNAVVKAQRAISSELVPDSLYRKILKIALENAGAQRACLVLMVEDRLKVQAEIEGDRFLAVSENIEETKILPRSIVQYAARLKRKVLLSDARKANPFSADDYLRDRQPVSILCLPILRKNELLALLYLENNLASHSFSEESQMALEMLASQAAISIENSNLYEDLKRSLRARDEFMAIASHELKSPLSSASIYVQTLRIIIQKRELGRYSEEKLLQLLDSSTNSLKHLASLVDQLLDVTRITLGNLVLSPETVNLSSLISDVAARFREDLKNADCALVLDLEPEIHGHWDKLRLEQVITNLLSNAIKYAAGQPIVIKTRNQGENAVISVQDRGIGIAPADRKRLFRPFERAVPYRSISGFGLGLFIVRKVVDSHFGSISLDSEVGKGTTFTIELPLRKLPLKEGVHGEF